ncbi:TIGR01777 family oxidoreductase [Desulfobaculum bizertense]|uniref:TIGR01777 family protein n=1 Tax=Desulfobaculum bizertense DSM 18034 TaxID=1121442 RepID=A0A1T4WHI1_9BACT|nr:TIGR01777 family oxidoreductase [Desulfobaculum bizertense]UIJ39360.1 TIGR01777 family oxidoreductase [Desulfobaculum bizertense]SKA76667.1 hypothetical protein SAMN02745702_02286 [Desulfobaculum bizertense DSM 18034]
MRVVVTGGTGFIGRRLCIRLVERGFDVVVTSRNTKQVEQLFGQTVVAAHWDGRDADELAKILDDGRRPATLVNLLGENIGTGRWTEKKKRRIRDSRVKAGKAVQAAVENSSLGLKALVQGSAIGLYGADASLRDDQIIEDSAPGSGFLAQVCEDWEASVSRLATRGVRVAYARTGAVLGAGGGMLGAMLPAFRWCLGGPIGSGEQWLSWIHLRDEVEALTFLVERDEAEGAFNLCAPGAVCMEEFSKMLGAALRRPSWFRVPEWLLRLGAGEMAEEMLLASQRAWPERLLQCGFDFRYPELRDALCQVLGEQGLLRAQPA